MVFVRILQSWSIDDVIPRTDEAKKEGESGTEA